MKVLFVFASLSLLVISTAHIEKIELFPSRNVVCPASCTEQYIPTCAMSKRCTAIIRNPCYKDLINCQTHKQDEVFYGVSMKYCDQAGLNRRNSIICRPN